MDLPFSPEFFLLVLFAPVSSGIEPWIWFLRRAPIRLVHCTDCDPTIKETGTAALLFLIDELPCACYTGLDPECTFSIYDVCTSTYWRQDWMRRVLQIIAPGLSGVLPTGAESSGYPRLSRDNLEGKLVTADAAPRTWVLESHGRLLEY